MVNVASYQHGVGGGAPWRRVDGFSEAGDRLDQRFKKEMKP